MNNFRILNLFEFSVSSCFWVSFELFCSKLLCLLPLPPLSQEGDDYEVIPNSNFYVSRTANKDNSSAYHINGKKATFKDVGALLRSHGIDLDHNRFLILQVIVFLFLFLFSLLNTHLLFVLFFTAVAISFRQRCPAFCSVSISFLLSKLFNCCSKVIPVCEDDLLHWIWKGCALCQPLDCFSSASWFETMWKGANHYLLL